LAVGLFGLAGIPPFVGFMGKFMVLTSALRGGQLLVVCLAALNTAIAIFYYLNVVKAAYTAEPESRPLVVAAPSVQATGLILVAAIVLFGVLPSRLVEYAWSVVQSML
jgi:NADH-quinone oxidoreductase subunit N